MLKQYYFTFPVPKTQNYYHLGIAQQFGLRIEKYIQSELMRRGHNAKLLSDFSASYDILVDGNLPVEVKAAKRTMRKNGRLRWQFCLAGGLNYQQCDFIYALVAIDQHGEIFTYIIPSAFVGNRRFIEFSSHPNKYKGMWAQYRDAWQWVDEVATWRTRLNQQLQLSLFGGVQ